MARPKTGDEPDPIATEGPMPPGMPEPDESEPKTAADLRAEAEQRGVLPDEGSGSGGRVVRADLEAALEHAPPEPPAGRPPLAMVAEAAAQVPPPESERE